MQQQSGNNGMLFSLKDIRSNPEFNVSGVVATGGADRRPAPGGYLHVTVPVLTRPEERRPDVQRR